VMVIKVGVTGKSEGPARRSSQLELRRQPDSPRHCGSKLPGKAAVNLFARCERERKPVQRAEVDGGISRSPATRMVSQVITGNRFMQCLAAVGKAGSAREVRPPSESELI